MNDRDYNDEKNYIYNVARINGYDKKLVDNIFKKHTAQQHTRQRTTLTTSRDTQTVTSLPFFPKLSNPLSTALRKYNINTVTRNTNTLGQKLCNYKDKQPPLSTSGIYQISCRNCDTKYVGQSRRAISERLKEHKGATENGHLEKSSVAEHMRTEQHQIDEDDFKRLKLVINPQKFTPGSHFTLTPHHLL